MVQQNIVAYILSQIQAGKSLEEINGYLIKAGYDKQEVESSVQYVINVEKNPQLAEQQRIQQLANYIQTQVNGGYDQQVIVNFLISRGYPYYEVNSAINVLKAPKIETRVEHKLTFVALMTIILVSVGIGIFYLSSVVSPEIPAKLLDVTTNKLSTLVKPGDDLSFQVNVVNLGDVRRYDITLDYEIINKDTNQVISAQTETVAISTTTQRVVSLNIPGNVKPGKYLLKATATYESFNATSGFLFQIMPTSEAEAIAEQIEELIPEELKDKIPDFPEVPGVTPEVPLPPTIPEPGEPTPTEPGEEIKIPQTEEEIFLSKTRAEAIEFVKAVSIRDLPKAISLCKKFKYDSQQSQCIQELAKYKKNPAACQSIDQAVRKDSCTMQVIIETGDINACKQIGDAMMRQGCEMFGMAQDVKDDKLTPEQKAQIPQITFEIPPGVPAPPSMPQMPQ
ncbi:hypothetical protein ACFL0V_06080 [Nanoarchaeota archaeon]